MRCASYGQVSGYQDCAHLTPKTPHLPTELAAFSADSIHVTHASQMQRLKTISAIGEGMENKRLLFIESLAQQMVYIKGSQLRGW